MINMFLFKIQLMQSTVKSNVMNFPIHMLIKLVQINKYISTSLKFIFHINKVELKTNNYWN